MNPHTADSTGGPEAQGTFREFVEAPQTGDETVDRAVADLARTSAAQTPAELDGQLAAGEQLQKVLADRLADLEQ